MTKTMWLLLALFLTCATAPAQEEFGVCSGIVDTVESGSQQLINVIQSLAVVYVDFPEGRMPNGQPPQDTSQLQGLTWNSIGSLGWDRADTNSSFYPVIRKYTYEDYWDQLFSVNEWVGTRHPDYSSHNGWTNTEFPDDLQQNLYRLTLRGSMRDYWDEVSYGNMLTDPAPTRSTGGYKQRTGIVNRIDNLQGVNYIKWISLPEAGTYYDYYPDAWRIYNHTRARLIALHNLPTDSSEYIEFDIVGHELSGGKLAIIRAGGDRGGWAVQGGSWYTAAEKLTLNQNPGSILTAILENTHEFGHTIGFGHYEAFGHDVMHSRGLSGESWNCPPHLNPWEKIRQGWIPLTNIMNIRSDTTVALTPINLDPQVGVITVYGEAGRNGNWTDHSDYFIVEYRKREGFNRFTGGEFVDGSFTGGALVWHYSSVGLFPNGPVEPHLGLKIRNYGQTYVRPVGDPTHLYPYHTQVYGEALDSSSNPNSSSILGLTTGLSVNDFSIDGGSVSFDVEYGLGSVPDYDVFLYGSASVPSTWTGSVYLQRIIFSQITINPGSTVDIAPAISFSQNATNPIRAIGTSSQPITFQGVGYGNHRAQWNYMLLPPASPSTLSELRHCIIRNATAGVYIPGSGSLSTPIVRSCTISDCVHDISLHGTNPSNGLEIAGLDSNTFSKFLVVGSVKLASADFTTPANSTLILGYPNGTASVQVAANRILTITDPVEVLRNFTFTGGTIQMLSNFTIPNGITATINEGTTLAFASGTGLVSYGTLLAVATGYAPHDIKLSSLSPSGTWAGVVLSGTGANGSRMEYVNVDRVYTFKGSAVSVIGSTGAVIRNCTITNNVGVRTSALLLSSAGSPDIGQNSFSNNPGTGVYFYNTNGVFYGNVVKYNAVAGVKCSYYSSPQFGASYFQAYLGNNTIKGSGDGVYAETYSSPLVGGTMKPWFGYNDIDSTSGARVRALNNSGIVATGNWWGSATPNAAWFVADGSSFIDWTEYLTSDPTPGMRPGENPKGAKGKSSP